MISALCWVPRGVAAATPKVVEPSPEDLAEIANLEDQDAEPEDSEEEMSEEESEEEETAEDEVAKARAVASVIQTGHSSQQADVLESAMRELNMDKYDDSDEESNVAARVLGRGKTEYVLNDSYITADADDDDEDDEIEDLTIKPTDLLLLAARNDDDVNTLEVWVYEEADGGGEANIYPHHDLILPSFPLALAWMDCDPLGQRERANMVAVSTMEPGIEIWDLDVMDAVLPVATLGGEETPSAPVPPSSEDDKKKKKKKKSKSATLLPGSHEGAVLGLAWNATFRNVLASAGEDKTVKVWDVSACKCEHTLTHHSSKVQCVAWNPAEAPVLLTGGFDKQACLVDVRTPDGTPGRWTVTADVECITWVPHDPTCFMVSSEDGIVACFDARLGAGAAPVYRIGAHDKPTCAMSFSTAAPGLLVTASTDKKIKFWDVSTPQPALLYTSEPKLGAVFASLFCRDVPYLLAMGGAKESVGVLDIRSIEQVVAKFPQLLQAQ